MDMCVQKRAEDMQCMSAGVCVWDCLPAPTLLREINFPATEVPIAEDPLT